MVPPTLDDVVRRHGVRLVLQFGSTVSGQTHQGSDLDLAVLLDRHSESTDASLALIADLQSLYPGREIDVAILNHADPLFLKKIMERCRLLYGSAADLQRLKLYAFKKYQDHRRFLTMERDYVRRKSATAR